MASLKSNKNPEKQRKPSEGKPNPFFEYKLPKQRSSNYSHNRSTSLQKKKKQKMLTEYDQYDNQHSNEKKHRKSFNSKRLKSNYFLPNKQSAQQFDFPQTNKNTPKKSQQLKGILTKNKQNQEQKIKNKEYNLNHPLIRFVNNKNKDAKEDQKSSEKKVTKKADKYQKNFAKVKKSNSKNKKNSGSKRNPSLSINKDQIKIKNKDSARKGSHEQETVKTIKKNEQKSLILSRLENEEESFASSEGFGLTQEEEDVFGNRFPFGFQKVRLLGRGGFSLVWEGKHVKSGKEFAIKQIITQNTHQTHLKQIWFGTNFYLLGGIPKPQFVSFEGVNNLVRLYSYEIAHTDTWLFYEKCGSSLGSSLYDIRSERAYGGDQRMYKMIHKTLYQQMIKDSSILDKITIEICKSLVLLNECQIVHSDLKTQNILIKYEKESQVKIKEVKLIDYGSSFQFSEISQFSMATPEYMPPEILNYIMHENDGEYEESLYREVMQNYKNPWCIDIFSLGCVVLEILVGVPLWMSLPLLIPSKKDSLCQKEGLFASKGRIFKEIIKKQRKIINKLDFVLENQTYSRIPISEKMKKALKGMLEINHNERISPHQVINILGNSD